MKDRIKIISLLHDSSYLGKQLTIYGWARTVRDGAQTSFIALNDGSCLSNLQLIIDKNNLNDNLKDEFNKISTGASLMAVGRLQESPAKGQSVELVVDSLKVLGIAPSDYPLQKKATSMEFLREIAHLRGRSNTFGAVMRVRNKVSYAIHNFFQSKGFNYIHTPIITGSDAEGAGEMFQLTTLPLDKLKGEVDYSKDFFGKKAHLTVSGQLNVEAYCLALGDVYTFGPTFRAENSNTVRHLAEFWMVEPELAFCDIKGNIAIAEEFLKYLINDLLTNSAEDMAFFDQRIKPGIIDELRKVAASAFEVITYTQAVELLEKSGKKFEFPLGWGLDLKSEHERYLTEELIKGPVIVTDYPKDIKSFYMKLNDDGKTVRGMDILVPGVGEIIGGSEREDNYDTLLQRINQCGLNPDDYSWYLDLRKYGSVPHSGFGLGLERFLMYVTGMANMRDVIPFPRAPKLCEY
ncbi:MAG: asparagine--tRNA ligase [Spirochaetaceae bacterium]|nr:asparagine--tRNA ligase [Spirochaetaceae bacterium]